MKNTSSSTAAALGLALGLSLFAGHALAQVNNGNFAAGLSGWTVLGDAVAQSSTLTLTTAYAGPGDSDTQFNLSGLSAQDISLLTPAAGVPANGLDLGGQPATEGTLVQQNIGVLAGQTLSFKWSFATHETLYLDHAFVVLAGQVYTLASTAAAPLGLQTYSHTFATAGTVLLSFGVVDTYDVVGVSSLSVSNVLLSAVPEPASWALLLLGVGVGVGAGMGGMARRAQAALQLREP